MTSCRRRIYYNPKAKGYRLPNADECAAAKRFHESLPSYAPTPLISLDEIARELGVKKVYIKDESSRLGLPSFKILGASWATYRAVSAHLGLSNPSFEVLADAAKKASVKLTAATDGNHGRAVARMATLFSISADIYVPKGLDVYTQNLIASEGATVTVAQGDYDDAVQAAANRAKAVPNGILIQDTSFEDYDTIPAWIVHGYSTMMGEIDDQLEANGLKPTILVSPVGVGSLCQAVTSHCKTEGRSVSVLTVEPDTAACLHKSLRAGELAAVKTSHTIMSGLDCGTVSPLAWPILREGIDASVTISDYESHLAVQHLESLDVKLGPCGAAGLAAIRHIGSLKDSGSLELSQDSVIVILGTEGARPYATPKDVSSDDPVKLTQLLTQINSSNPSLSNAGGVGESEIANFITAWLEHRDIETHRIEHTTDRPSIIGVLRGSGGRDGAKSKSLMLNGHMDTVSLASYSPDLDPLSGEVLSSKSNAQVVVGRGSLDMKSGLAAAMSALATAKSSPSPPRGDVILAAVSDEEHGSLGTEEMLKAGWRADGAIVTEPTQLVIGNAHKGFTWVEVEIRGVAAHGSRPDEGVDAILHMGNFLTALKDYANTLPEDAELGKASLHGGLINGGEEPSSYPESCKVTIEFRTVPPQTSDSIISDINHILSGIQQRVPSFNYSQPRLVMQRPPLKVSPDHEFVKMVTAATSEVFAQCSPLRSQTFWCDAALLHAAGIPAVIFGPSGAGLHSKEEWVDVESIRKTEALLSTVIRKFCN